jgi:four helix bundle protein
MKRAAVSILSNIAEGRRRQGRKSYKQFLVIAYSSGAELEAQIEISKRLSFGSSSSLKRVESLLTEVMKMLNKTIYTLNLTT